MIEIALDQFETLPFVKSVSEPGQHEHRLVMIADMVVEVVVVGVCHAPGRSVIGYAVIVSNKLYRTNPTRK